MKKDEGKANVVDNNASSSASKLQLQCTPTDKEMDDLFLKLNDCKTSNCCWKDLAHSCTQSLFLL